LILLAASAVLILLGLSLAPDFYWLLPRTFQNDPERWAFGAILAGYLAALARTLRSGPRSPSSRRLGRGLERLDEVSAAVLQRWLVVGLAATAVAWLASWIPHYLSWPWNRDVEAFSEYAREWDEGVLPYRDIRGYNFPGHIYLHWLIGKAFGWGRPWAFYAVDAVALLALGAAVLAWSRRLFRKLLPGMAAYVFFLSYYLDQHFEVVAERDWHAALGATLGLLVLQGWPGRRARWLSAFLIAAASTIRPHVVLFLPALGYAAATAPAESDAGAEPVAQGRFTGAGARRLLEWGFAFGLFAAAGFAPLVVAGVLDDLVRNLGVVSYGGPYSTFTADRALSILSEEIRRLPTAALVLALAFMSLRSPGDLRGPARAWLVAVLGALVYRPMHPMDHGYLRTPLALASSTAWAIPIAGCLRFASDGPARLHRSFLALCAVSLLLIEILPVRFPYNCLFSASLDAIRAAATSSSPPMPPGAWAWFDRTKQPFYTWDGYTALLRYLRETTGPNTVVANALNNPPFPCVNGPTGRRSPFRVETGVAWMWLVRQDLDEEFARDLENAGEDSVVVWSPGEIGGQPRLPLPRLARVIRDEYEPEARFEKVEVWRRKGRPSADRLQSRGKPDAPHPPQQVAPP
jgi:hypothetical protein